MVSKSKYFQRKKVGRRTNPLVRLAAYRYSQGEDKPHYLIDKGLKNSKIIKEDYGEDLFKKIYSIYRKKAEYPRIQLVGRHKRNKKDIKKRPAAAVQVIARKVNSLRKIEF